MRIISGFCIREILDEIVAIPTGEASQFFLGVISLNEMGKNLFEMLNEEQTVQSLVNAVVSEYDVDEKTAETDIIEFLDYLREKNLLIEE